MTEAMRFLRVNISGHVSMNTALEPGRVHIELSDSLGHPGLRWFVTPCDYARFQQCLAAAIAHYQGDATVAPPTDPPAAAEPPPPGGGEPATANITSISNASPAVLTIGEADYANFASVSAVTIAGNSIATANGPQTLQSANPTAFTFELAGLDLSLEAAPGTGGTVTDASVARGAKRGSGRSKRAA